MGADDFRRVSHEIAEAIAPGWERQRGFVERVTTPVREWMIRELAPQAGETVLEVAAGAGDTGFEAASVLGEGGRLISTDFSPSMLAVARRRGAELGVGNVDYLVMDGEHLELEADAVDGVLCRFGYMLMADPAAALSEARRVLRSGGRLALAVWGRPDQNPFFAIAAMRLVERGHMPPPGPGSPSPFSLADPARIRQLLEEAGFGSVRTEEVPVRFSVADVDHYLGVTADTAGPVGIVLRGLSADEREALKAHLAEAFTPFAGDQGYEVPGLAICAVAS